MHGISKAVLFTCGLCTIPYLAEGQTSVGSGEEIGEITVTAQKTAQTIQRVPLAVTAVSQDTLLKSGVTDLAGLATMAPSVNMGEENSGARITIRGIGLEAEGAGPEAPVAFNQDGVYIARTEGAMLSFFDINRVEVLRGPQGTLYGRNATGGAVNVISNDPTGTLGGYFRFTAGDYGLFASEGAVGGPITDNLNGRIAFRTSSHDGYGHNIATGNGIDAQNERAFRAKLEFLPIDHLRILLSADYAKADDSLGVARHYLGRAQPGDIPTGTLFGGSLGTSLRDVNNEIDPKRIVDHVGTNLVVSYDLGFAELKSISAYEHTRAISTNDLDATELPVFSPFTNFDYGQQSSEELQLTGKADRLDWLVGLFYYHENLHAYAEAPIWTGLFTPPGTPAYLAQGYYAGSYQATDAEAAFSQLTYHFTDTWSATVGGRYSNEGKDVIDQFSFDVATPVRTPYNPYGNLFNPAIGTTCSDSVEIGRPDCVPHKRWNSFTPKFGIQYQPTQNVMAYVSATKGFRAGAYSLGGSQGPVNPETVWSYEAGLRAKFLENRLTTNLTGFYYNYTNLQVTENNGTTTIVKNAATARIKGIEAEIQFKPIDDFRFDFSGSYLDARFTRFISSDPSRPLGDGVTSLGGSPAFNLEGNYLPQSPKFSFLSGIEGYFGQFTARGEATYTTKVYFDPFNTEEASAAAKTRFNASLNYRWPDDRWTAQIAVRNIANKVQATNGFVTTALTGPIVIGSIEPPRTVTASVGYRF